MCEHTCAFATAHTERPEGNLGYYSSPPALLEAAAPFHCRYSSLLVQEVLGSSHLPLPACCRNTGITYNVWLYVSSGDLKSGLYFGQHVLCLLSQLPSPQPLAKLFELFLLDCSNNPAFILLFLVSVCISSHFCSSFYSFLLFVLVSCSFLQLLSWKLR